MHTSTWPKIFATLLLVSNCLAAQSLVLNGSLERANTAPADHQLEPGSIEIPSWSVGPQGGIDAIRTLWPASDGRDCVDLHSGDLGPGAIFQDVNLTNGVRYRLSFDMAYNTQLGLPVTLGVSIGSLSNTFTRSVTSASPFWQRRDLLFTPTNTGMVRLSFQEKGLSPAGSPEVSIDNIQLEVAPPQVSHYASGAWLETRTIKGAIRSAGEIRVWLYDDGSVFAEREENDGAFDECSGQWSPVKDRRGNVVRLAITFVSNHAGETFRLSARDGLLTGTFKGGGFSGRMQGRFFIGVPTM